MASIGPGPTYGLPPTIGFEKHDQRKTRSPQYTMAGRFKERIVNIVPGPNLNLQNTTQRGKNSSPAYSMAPRSFPKDPKKIGPGPANYDLTKKPYVSASAPPAYSLGRRDNFRFKNICPGPNAYGIKDKTSKKSAPAYSLGARIELKTKGGSPGPANYPAGKLRVTMDKAPEYSLSPRLKYIDKKIVPGSNAYNRMNYKPGNQAPAYSFGVRHSPRAPPFIVPCDKV